MSDSIRRIASVTFAAWLAVHGPQALAAATHWNTNSDGNFNAPENWANGIPDSDDAAVFDRGDNVSYTVTLNGGAIQMSPVVHTVDRLVVNGNSVNLVRNPLSGPPSLVVNNASNTDLNRGIDIGTVASHATLSTSIPVTAVTATIGDAAQSVGTWNVIGSSVTLTSEFPSKSLIVGNNGTGTLNVSGGGAFNVSGSNSNVLIGDHPGAEGTIDVGSGSTFSVPINTVYVGTDGGSGALFIHEGGSFSTSGMEIGAFGAGSDGKVQIGGPGALLDVTSISVGDDFRDESNRKATLDIFSGAQVQSTFVEIGGRGTGSSSHVNIDGLGTTWTLLELHVGSFKDATAKSQSTFFIQGGAAVSNDDASVGCPAGSTCDMFIGSATWTIAGRLGIGGDAIVGKPLGAGEIQISTGATVSVAEDTLLYPGARLMLTGGTFAAPNVSFEGGGEFQWKSGTLHVGVFNDSLINPERGVLAPGAGDDTASTTIVGNYTQHAGAKLQIGIGGTSAGGTHDLVGVTGHAVLGGDLELELVDGFVPSAVNTFTIFNTGGGIFGVFANVTTGARLTTADGNGSFIVNYGAGSAFNQNQIILSAFQSVLAGDYNHNGVVDAADYAVWRKSLGQSGRSLAADGNGSGEVDADDYKLWRANFGRHGDSGAGGTMDSRAAKSIIAPVPEPATLALATLWLVIRRRDVRGSSACQSN